MPVIATTIGLLVLSIVFMGALYFIFRGTAT